MNNMKTFEEFWPFRQESQTEKNKKIMIGVCDYLLAYYTTHNLFGSKVKKVDVGQSSKINKIQIGITLENSDCLRITYKIDENYMVTSLESFYVLKNDEITLHSSKRQFNPTNSFQYRVMDLVVERINYYFKLYKIMA